MIDAFPLLWLPLPSVVTITANQHFAVNRWNPNYSGTTHNSKPASQGSQSTEKPAAAASDAKGGEGSKGEAQGIFSLLHSSVRLEPDLHFGGRFDFLSTKSS